MKLKKEKNDTFVYKLVTKRLILLSSPVNPYGSKRIFQIPPMDSQFYQNNITSVMSKDCFE